MNRKAPRIQQLPFLNYDPWRPPVQLRGRRTNVCGAQCSRKMEENSATIKGEYKEVTSGATRAVIQDDCFKSMTHILTLGHPIKMAEY
jgi:hypothetical protein